MTRCLRRLIEGIRDIVIWCLCAGILAGFSYGMYCLTYDPGYATQQECRHSLFLLQYDKGHDGEECLELENGHWKIFDRDRQ
jgi:hypothetical protein